MKKQWPKVRLGEVLHRTSAAVAVRADVEYPNFGVYSFGRGLFRKLPIPGALTSASTLYKAKAGQFVYSRLFAFEGAYGVVSPEFDGYYVSNEFPLFDCNLERVVPEFIAGYVRQPHIWRSIAESATGVGHRRQRVQPAGVLAYEIPLPPLPAQRRVVKWINGLSARIQEAGALRQQAAAEAGIVYEQSRNRVLHNLRCEYRQISELFDLVNGRAFTPEDWHGTGRRIIRIQNLKYPGSPYNRYSGRVDPKHLVNRGDLLFAWSGQVVSLGAHIWPHEEAVLNQHIFNVRSKIQFEPEFAKEGFNALIDEMKTQVRGLEMFHIRKQELEKLAFPCPGLSEQRRVVAELRALEVEVNAVKHLQAESTVELDTLLQAVLARAFKEEL